MKLSLEINFDIKNTIDQEFIVWFENNKERCKPLLLMGFLMVENGLTLYYDEKYKKEVESIWIEKYERLQCENQKYLQACKETNTQLHCLKDVYERLYEEKYKVAYENKMHQITVDREDEVMRLMSKIEQLKVSLDEERCLFQEQKQALNKELLVLKDQNAIEFEALLERRIEETTKVKDVEVISLKTQIDELRQNYNDIKGKCKEYEDKYTEAITLSKDDYTKFIKDEKIMELTQVINKLNGELNVFKSSNTYKGAIGEKCLRDIISNNFIDCEVIDTSKTGGVSDIHVILPHGGIIAIESKNKANITNQDVCKSLTDIHTLNEMHGDKFQGYLFVSHRTRNIPKKGGLYYEVSPEGIPIIWYGVSEGDNIEPGLIMLMKVLLCVCSSNVLNKDEHMETDINLIMNVVKAKMEIVAENVKLCSSIQENVNAMLHNVNTLKMNNQKIYDDLLYELGIKEGSLQRSTGGILEHVKGDGLTCNICNKVFKRKCDLKNHLKKGH
jgi:hypothetical protein